MMKKFFHAGMVALGFILFLHSALMSQVAASPSRESELFGEKTWFHQGEMAFIAGDNSSDTQTSLSLAMINGLRITNHIAAGIGIGWDYYDRINVYPVFGRVIGLLKPTGHTPFAFVDAGYGWVHERDTPPGLELINADGGLMLQTGAGYMFKGSGSWRISLHAAYKIQKSQAEYKYATGGWWWGMPSDAYWSEERTRKRFVAGISFLF